ncbi:MAG: AAA family ATPase, partial [Campylobacter ureolyticus]|nr:AAA family ATPase [Campylobacter ureolyticus]
AKKSFNQIKNDKNSFVASDNLEIGFGSKIPLWLFGLMY